MPEPFIEPTPIPNVGLYGTPGTLPTGPGPADPIAGGPSYGHWNNPNNSILAMLDRYMSPNWGVGNGSSGSTEQNYPAPGDGAPPPTRSWGRRAFDRTAPGTILNIIKRMADASGQTWDENARYGGSISPRVTYTRGSPVGGNSGFQQMHPGEYTQATFGGVTPTGFRDPSGSATFDAQAANRQLMMSQTRAGNPNSTQSFATNGRFLLDEQGVPIQYGPQAASEMVTDPAAVARWANWSQADQMADHARTLQERAAFNNGLKPFAWLTPPPPAGTISGPPEIPGGFFRG